MHQSTYDIAVGSRSDCSLNPESPSDENAPKTTSEVGWGQKAKEYSTVIFSCLPVWNPPRQPGRWGPIRTVLRRAERRFRCWQIANYASSSWWSFWLQILFFLYNCLFSNDNVDGDYTPLSTPKQIRNGVRLRLLGLKEEENVGEKDEEEEDYTPSRLLRPRSECLRWLFD